MADPIEIRVPDIGDFEDVEIVEVLVSAGDRVAIEDPLVTLESDKASMEVPSPRAGVVAAVKVAVTDKVSEGAVLVLLDVDSDAPEPAPAGEGEASGERDATGEGEASGERNATGAPQRAREAPEVEPEATADRAEEPEDARETRAPLPEPGSRPPVPGPVAPVGKLPHASPLVRGFARELGVDLQRTAGSGPHARILAEDVKAHVRETLRGRGAALPEVPAVDFSRFGEVEEQPLTRVQRVAGANLSRSWLNVPHVTQHDEADVTALEAFRRSRAPDAAERGLKLSPLVFVMKACVRALQEHPAFRSSLAPGGESLIVKSYYHLGIAVDTEEGLVVPVVRDVDRKRIFELAAELADLSERARARKLAPGEMQGAVFTISSLGGIGGTAFTPIVNAPEVAVLGLSRIETKPVWRPGEDGAPGEFEPRQILPLSLSYDHRVIDGAAAARFTTTLSELLHDVSNLLL